MVPSSIPVATSSRSSPTTQQVMAMGFSMVVFSTAQESRFGKLFCFANHTCCSPGIRSWAFFLIEHPEDLGTVNGEAPASIWQLDEMRNLQITTNATTWAIFQCGFGADTSKPTRFLSSIPGIRATFSKWPAFDEQGKYVGPLPARCTHTRHIRRLIGKDSQGRWVTGPAASYPPGLCKYLANLVVSVLRKGGTHDITEVVRQTPPTTVSGEHLCCGQSSLALPMDVDKGGDTPKPDAENGSKQMVAEKPAAQTNGPTNASGIQHTVSDSNWGRPMMVEWSGEEREITDGFGLCSPNRWAPDCRGVGQSTQARDITRSTTCSDVLFMNRWEICA